MKENTPLVKAYLARLNVIFKGMFGIASPAYLTDEVMLYTEHNGQVKSFKVLQPDQLETFLAGFVEACEFASENRNMIIKK